MDNDINYKEYQAKLIEAQKKYKKLIEWKRGVKNAISQNKNNGDKEWGIPDPPE